MGINNSTSSMCVVSFVGDDKLIFTILFSISINFLYCFSQHFNGEQPKITNISNSYWNLFFVFCWISNQCSKQKRVGASNRTHIRGRHHSLMLLYLDSQINSTSICHSFCDKIFNSVVEFHSVNGWSTMVFVCFNNKKDKGASVL